MKGRAQYLIKRTIQSAFLIWLIITLVFLMFRLLPGDYGNILIFRGATAETVARFEKEWGLNEPLYIQYLKFMNNLIHLNAGVSLRFQKPVVEVVRMRLFNSIILIAPAITLAYIVGSIFGAVLGGTDKDRLEEVSIGTMILLSSIPSFLMGIILIVIFALQLGWFPTSGMFSFSTVQQYSGAAWWRIYLTKDFAIHYFLPFMTIFVRYLYFPVLIMRTSFKEVIGQDFFFYQRLTGLSYPTRMRNFVRHSILPVVTMYPLSMTQAVGGLVLVETVFNWPGIGYSLVEAVLDRDFPVAIFVFILIAIFIVVSNFIVDILYGVIDPRISLSDSE